MCKDSLKLISGYQRTLGATKDVAFEQFWYQSKVDAIDRASYLFTGPEHCTHFEKEL